MNHATPTPGNAVSVLILTKNEEQDLPGCLASVAWCDDVHVIDSESTDATRRIAEEAGATVTVRRFEGYATGQLRRCPGAASQPAADGSSPWRDVSGALDCDPTQVPPGP